MDRGRRLALAALAGGLAAACDRRREPATEEPAPPESGAPALQAEWRTLDFPVGEGAPEGQRALLFAPDGARDLPLLVALGGGLGAATALVSLRKLANV